MFKMTPNNGDAYDKQKDACKMKEERAPEAAQGDSNNEFYNQTMKKIAENLQKSLKLTGEE